MIPTMTKTTTQHYSYTAFLAQVQANKVKSASIDPKGAITGTLQNGNKYTSQIPVAINDTALAPTLKGHAVNLTGVATPTNILPILLSLLPILIFIGLFVWIGRRTRKQVGGIAAFGRSKAKVYDAERPSTRFSDIAGYDGAKQEVTQPSASCGSGTPRSLAKRLSWPTTSRLRRNLSPRKWQGSGSRRPDPDDARLRGGMEASHKFRIPLSPGRNACYQGRQCATKARRCHI
jgi:FtsH Extracellular